MRTAIAARPSFITTTNSTTTDSQRGLDIVGALFTSGCFGVRKLRATTAKHANGRARNARHCLSLVCVFVTNARTTTSGAAPDRLFAMTWRRIWKCHSREVELYFAGTMPSDESLDDLT